MISNEQINAQISNTLKMRRKQRGWSLDKTAEKTGVSKAMLGQIERRESSPTIATLWKIATGLQCSFSSFLTPGSDSFEHTAQPFSADNSFAADANMKVNTLFAYSPLTQTEMFEITLLNRHEQFSSAHQQGVLEHIHVIEGKLEVLQNGQWLTATADSPFLLHADVDHGYRDLAGKTRFIDMIYYP